MNTVAGLNAAIPLGFQQSYEAWVGEVNSHSTENVEEPLASLNFGFRVQPFLRNSGLKTIQSGDKSPGYFRVIPPG